MRKRLSRLILGLILLLVITGVLLWKYFPYQNEIERKIRSTLEANGIKVNSLEVEKINNTEAVLTGIDLGDKATVNIAKLKVNYVLQEILATRFYSGTDVHMIAENIILNAKPYSIAVKSFATDATRTNKDSWKGKITADLTFAGLPEEVPPLALTSDFTVQNNDVNANIYLADEKKLYTASMVVNLPGGKTEKGTLNIKNSQFPWGGGIISANGVSIPVKMDQPVTVKIMLRDVQLTQLLGKVSEGKIDGDGKISGAFPITYYPDGHITLDKGTAGSQQNGTIKVSPELIQGENAQLTVVRTTLENFHYTTLKISVSSDKDEKSVINLALEGRNPDMEDERPVKLNINLAGDIIPLLQQSILPINDFREYLKEAK